MSDPLLKPRSLFRDSVVARFSGPGDLLSALLLPSASRRLPLAAAALVLGAALALGLAGSLPVRVDVDGAVEDAGGGRLRFVGRVPEGRAGTGIQVGQGARVALFHEASARPAIAAGAVNERSFSHGSAGIANERSFRNGDRVTIDLPDAPPGARASPSARASITVARRSPLALLLEGRGGE